jgi:sigma-E factor negative regulatory protein RseA
MSEQSTPVTLNESLSALMDNEVSELELQRLLKASGNGELQAVWGRYQLARSALQGDMCLLADSQFSASVSAAIANIDVAAEAKTLTSKTATVVNLWQSLGKMAVAASVAGLVVLGVQQYEGEPSVQADIAINTPLEVAPTAVNSPANITNLPSGIHAPALNARTVALQSGYERSPQEARRVMFVPRQNATPVYNEEVSSYVNQLIEAHSAHASQNTPQGMLPYSRVILIDENRVK